MSRFALQLLENTAQRHTTTGPTPKTAITFLSGKSKVKHYAMIA
jgi:hypothetical protein